MMALFCIIMNMRKTYPYNAAKFKERRKKLRNNMPLSEISLWRHLRGSAMEGLKFRRQFGIGPYVVDFFCYEHRLAIELDGDSHFVSGAQEYDQRRQKYIEDRGIRFLRFLNTEVHDGAGGAVEAIRKEAKRLKSEH
jgi:very-short-patch-repair endonuclease